MYFEILFIIIWLTLVPQLITNVGVSVNGQLFQQRRGALKIRSDYKEDEYVDDTIDDTGSEGESGQRSLSPRTTMEYMGIYGACVEYLYTFTVVISQGGCVLVFDPRWKPYGCQTMGLMTTGCEKKDSNDICVGKYSPNWCFEAENGWYWFWGAINVGSKQHYKFFMQNTQEHFFTTKIKNIGGFPLMPSNVTAVLFPGRIRLYIQAPDFDFKGVSRQALGYRVSLMDSGLGEVWDIQTNLESVVYRCEFPELRPIHPCERYRKDKSFCVLVTEPVFWTNYRIATGMKYLKVESYFLPQYQENRWYSQPFIVIPPGPKQQYRMGPMYGYGNTTFPRKLLLAIESFAQPWLILCLVLAALILFTLLGLIPIVIYWSTRAAQREVEERWRAWADSPGNVGVGLGTDPIVWYGDTPWSLRPKPTQA